MRQRKPIGEAKKTCSKCGFPLGEKRVGKQRYCHRCHAAYMRLHRSASYKGGYVRLHLDELLSMVKSRCATSYVFAVREERNQPFLDYFGGGRPDEVGSFMSRHLLMDLAESGAIPKKVAETKFNNLAKQEYASKSNQ